MNIAKILLVDDAFLPQVAGLKKEDVPIEKYIYIGEKDCPEGLLSYEQLIAVTQPVGDSYRHDDDLAGIYYTGGTTGFPKGAMLTHKSIWTSTMGLQIELKLDEDSVFIHTGPMFHLADGAMSNAALLMGGKALFFTSFYPTRSSRYH